jgi:hypothetical protein
MLVRMCVLNRVTGYNYYEWTDDHEDQACLSAGTSIVYAVLSS